MEEFARQFGIDGKLLISQAVNFFLLLVVLRVFVYKPVLAVLRQRKERIEAGLRMAREAEEKFSAAEVNVAQKRWYEARAEAVEQAITTLKDSPEYTKLAPHQREIALQETARRAQTEFQRATGGAPETRRERTLRRFRE